ncbi:basic secretory protein-like protein [Pseudoalteromonas fenneropenaei]|uniref:Basic secretory protein-like protein n=1 Tax=Pseudoalteromonas fenneropenaei TaxID=1737459 RepID=A0ABV7CQN5_9GAMM
MKQTTLISSHWAWRFTLGASLLSLSSCALQNNTATSPVVRDITDYKGEITAQYADFILHEGIAQLFDKAKSSKYLSEHAKAWVQFSSENQEIVSRYSLTSAGDAPMRDSATWRLLASLDGNNWQVLDEQSGFEFAARGETVAFEIADPRPFKHFRLDMQSRGVTEWGDNYLQLADFALFAATELPLADFSIDKSVTTLGERVTLTSQTANQPTQQTWTIQAAGASNSALILQGEQVQFTPTLPGSYHINLHAENRVGEHQLQRENALKVLDPTAPWLGFTPAQVEVQFEDTSSLGYQRLVRLFPDLTQTINAVTLQLVPMLYRDFTQVPDFSKVTFQLKWMDTIAYRSGDESNMIIAFSSKYITERLAEQPDSQVEYELLGVLWHELTHGYQLFPKDRHYGEPQAHAFVEGMADLIRIQAGFHKTRAPKPSESWLGGYTNTGFFLAWLAEQHSEFAFRFNQTAHTISPWSFAAAIKAVTNEDLDELWQRYQQSLSTELAKSE